MASLSDRKGKFKHKGSFYDERGRKYDIFHDWDWSGKKVKTKVVDASTGRTAYYGKGLSASGAMTELSRRQPQVRFFSTESEYNTFKQNKITEKETERKAEGKSDEFKEELGEQIESAKEEMKALGESKDVEMRRIASRTAAVNQKSLTDTLLATGTDPAEAQAITQYGVDAQARTLSDVLSKSALATKEAVASFNNQEIQGVVNAEQFESKHLEMANKLNIQRESLANQLNIATLQSQTYADVNTPSTTENISGGVQAFGAGAEGLSYLKLAGLIGGVPVV
jgi:hypothetical protein